VIGDIRGKQLVEPLLQLPQRRTSYTAINHGIAKDPKVFDGTLQPPPPSASASRTPDAVGLNLRFACHDGSITRRAKTAVAPLQQLLYG
jgi:hypothetical protein